MFIIIALSAAEFCAKCIISSLFAGALAHRSFIFAIFHRIIVVIYLAVLFSSFPGSRLALDHLFGADKVTRIVHSIVHFKFIVIFLRNKLNIHYLE
jgi:hypothetical protein